MHCFYLSSSHFYRFYRFYCSIISILSESDSESTPSDLLTLLTDMTGKQLPSSSSSSSNAADAADGVNAQQEGWLLTGVDMIETTCAGIISWQPLTRPGKYVKKGDLLGEIVDIGDVDTPRVPIVARCDGIIYSMRKHMLSIPG